MDWDKRFSVLWSVVLCLTAAAVAASQVTSVTDLVPYIRLWAQPLILPLFVVLLTVILVALSLRIWKTVWDVIGLVALLALGVTPSVMVVLSPQLDLPIGFFLVALGFWLGVGVVAVAADSERVWPRVLLVLGAASTVATVFCEIGLRSPVQFAVRPMREVYGLSRAVDLRLALSALFGGLCVATATARAFWVTLPELPRIPIPQLPRIGEGHSILAPLTNPFIIVMNGALLVAISISNVLLGLLVTLFLRIVYIGFEFAKLLWQLLFEHNAALHLIKGVLAMLVTFSVIIISLQLSPHLRDYLRASPEAVYGQLPFVGALVLTVLLGATILTLVFDGRGVMLARVLFGASLLAVLLVLAGATIYALAFTHLVTVTGFDRVGPISIVGSVLMVVGIVATTLINIAEHRRGSPPS